jgi:hypothetical protein
VREAVTYAIAGATSSVFLWATVAAVIIAPLAFFIREVALRGGEPKTEPEPSMAAVQEM